MIGTGGWLLPIC